MASLLPGAVGGVVVGLCVNQLSSDFGYTAVGVALFATVLAWCAAYLRRTHPHAPLRGYVAVGLGVPGVAAVMTAAFASGVLEVLAVISAVLIVMAVALFLGDGTALGLLFTAGVPAAIVAAGREAAVLTGRGEILLGMASAGLALAAIVFSAMFWGKDAGRQIGMAAVVAGVACVLVGVDHLAKREPLLGGALIAFGAACVGFGVAVVRVRERLFGAAVVGIGAAGMLAGATFMAEGEILPGCAALAFGATGVVAEAARRMRRVVLIDMAFMVFGLGCVGLGAGLLTEGAVLLGAAGAMFGAGWIGLGWTSDSMRGVKMRTRHAWEASMIPPGESGVPGSR